MKKFKDITEARSKGATFTFGRFNPPTVGHMKKNPLTNSQIRKFMNPMLPRGVEVAKSDSKTVFDVVSDLHDKGYTSVKMVVGSDRIREFDSLLKKYRLGKQLYKAVQKGMGIREDFEDFMYEVYNGEWGTDKGREYAQKATPGQNVVSYVKKLKEVED